MITLSAVYILTGLIFAAVAVLSAGDRANPKRRRNAAFWALLALSFLAGSRIGDFGNGLIGTLHSQCEIRPLDRGIAEAWPFGGGKT